MGHGHHAAIAGAQADNGSQAQVLSQGFHVFDVLVERVEAWIAAGRSALSAVVKVNQLELFAQGFEGGFEIAVLERFHILFLLIWFWQDCIIVGTSRKINNFLCADYTGLSRIFK